jgi:hypothetical protein
MCLIDGARMLSPGIIKGALAAFREEPEPFVYTIGMHIGRHSQNALVESARLAVGPSEESLAARVRYLEGTWSWRITRPLRAAGTLARRARRRGASQPEPPGDPGAVKPIPGPQKQSLLVEWIRRIEDSRSWSITRPLRALAVLVKRALRRPINRPRPPTVSDEFVRAYRRAEEDWLLDSVDWRRNGYLLFTISTPAASVGEHGFHSPVRESNCFALRRTTFLDGGGFDERFRSPGGGLVNLDLFERFVENPRISPICLLGEATFHQFHGGVATNVRMQDHPWESFAAEYEAIRGRPYTSPNGSEPLYVGKVPKEARHLVRGD